MMSSMTRLSTCLTEPSNANLLRGCSPVMTALISDTGVYELALLTLRGNGTLGDG